jgi:hypothetical protein
MTTTSTTTARTRTAAPTGQRRRVKRGIVAGYIHDISPRHRAASTPIPVATATAPAPAAEDAAPRGAFACR